MPIGAPREPGAEFKFNGDDDSVDSTIEGTWVRMSGFTATSTCWPLIEPWHCPHRLLKNPEVND